MRTRPILLAFLALFTLLSASAQVKMRKENRNKIKALKIAYITDQLSLSEKEAEKFWPVYNAHEEILHQFRMVERNKIRKNIRDKGGLSSLSSKDAELMLSQMMDLEKNIYEANQKFRKKLLKFLPHKKILKLEYAERGFKREMFERLKRRKKQRMNKE